MLIEKGIRQISDFSRTRNIISSSESPRSIVFQSKSHPDQVTVAEAVWCTDESNAQHATTVATSVKTCQTYFDSCFLSTDRDILFDFNFNFIILSIVIFIVCYLQTDLQIV